MKHNIIFTFIFSVLIAPPGNGQIKVDPPNWWVGMNYNTVELLIYGNQIGALVPEITYSGVTITSVTKAKSANYLFLGLSIGKNTGAGVVPIQLKKGPKTIYTINYQLMDRNYDPGNLKGFNSSDVIYLITPDRFANGNPGNDVVEGMQETTINRTDDYGRHGGDIRGIIDHLDYLQEMGFTAIWPGPMLENDMRKDSYHGYAITDFYKVDPRFGTLAEYIELADKARDRGIKLIFDDLVNHTGSLHWWMTDLPFDDWINFPDTKAITNHRRTLHEDPYASHSEKELLTRGWFVTSMPDLNQTNPHMEKYLIQKSLWWIETLGLGGIRQDTYPYSDENFLRKWTCSIMNEYPNFSIVGEEWTTNPLVVAYWQQGFAVPGDIKGCLKSTMDFPMQSNLVQALNEPEGGYGGLIKLYEGLANDFIYANPQELLIFGDNHDMDRIYTQLNEDPDLTKMAMTYLLTIRGIPQIYYGTEILMQNTAERGSHGLIRSDFPGGWAGDASNAFKGEGLQTTQFDMQSYLKKMLNWRKDKVVIHSGKTLHFAPAGGVYVYFRYTNLETIMVVMNKGPEIILDTGRFKEIIGDKTSATNIITEETSSLSSGLKIDGKSAVVFEIK